MRKEELKCTTTHRGTDSPHPWQKRGPGESCGGRRLSKGMCEGPRAGGWRQRNSSLNENIKSKIRISPSSAAGVEDAVGGGLWTGGLVAPAWVHVQPVFSRYSATIRVSTALKGPRCSQLLTWSGHTSPISHSTCPFSRRNFFVFFTERAQRSIRFYTWAADVNFKTLLHSAADPTHFPSRKRTFTIQITLPLLCIQKYVRFLQLTTRP